MQPQPADFHDFLNPSVSFRRWDYVDAPCPRLCQRAAAQRLYSSGTDFTSWYIKQTGTPGSSYMKRFWERDLREEDAQEHEGGSIWLLEKNENPVGAVILERCAIKPIAIGDRDLHGRHASARPNKTFLAQPVGRVAMWLDPSMRGRGLMKLLVTMDVVPVLVHDAARLQEQGIFPFVRAGDASASILQSETDLPVPGFFRSCLNEKERLRNWMMTMGTEMHDHDRWAVDWQSAKPARKTSPGSRK